MAKTVSATEARIHFGELMRRVVEENEGIIVERAGKPMVAIVSISDYEALETLKKEQQAQWQQAIDRLEEIGEKVKQRLADKAIPTPEELIRQMREERSEIHLTYLR